jgi:hypothetical protein
VLGPVSISTTEVEFTYNSGPAVGAQITDWAFAGGPASVPASFLQVSGGATSVEVAGLGSRSVDTVGVTRRSAGAAGDGGKGDHVFLSSGDIGWFRDLGARLLGPELQDVEELAWGSAPG